MEEMWQLKPKIEALLVSSDRTVTIQALALCLEVTEDEADEALREFEADLLGADRGIQLRRRPHGVRIETKPQYADLIGQLLPERKAKPITSPLAQPQSNAVLWEREAAAEYLTEQDHPPELHFDGNGMLSGNNNSFNGSQLSGLKD